MLIDAGWKGQQGLKILCTGEALPVDLANGLVGRGDSVWNLYGPTETTIWSTLQRVERSEDRKSTRLNSSHTVISYAVFCLKKKKNSQKISTQSKTTNSIVLRSN